MSLKYNINVEENELNGNSDESKYNEKEEELKQLKTWCPETGMKQAQKGREEVLRVTKT